MEDILKIVKFLEDSELLLEGVKNEATEQKGEFLSMLLGTLGANLLGNVLFGKGVVRAGYGSEGKEQCELGMDLKDLQLKNYFDSATSFNKH